MALRPYLMAILLEYSWTKKEETVLGFFIDDEGLLDGVLRFPDEFVRHKILDLIGDLSLMKSPLAGHFKAHRGGHGLHLKTVHFLLNNPEYIGIGSQR